MNAKQAINSSLWKLSLNWQHNLPCYWSWNRFYASHIYLIWGSSHFIMVNVIATIKWLMLITTNKHIFYTMPKQYAESFLASLVDARMLDTISKKELEKYLGVTRKFHQASIVHGIHLLRIMKYDRQVSTSTSMEIHTSRVYSQMG